MAMLPDIYFRVKDNGAIVFRVDTENRQRRIEMDQIATVNVKNGEIKPHSQRDMTQAERDACLEWLAQRQADLKARDIDDIHRAIDHLNLVTHWAQSKAEDDALDDVTDKLLLAMHDLRSVLVRKKADRVMKDRETRGS